MPDENSSEKNEEQAASGRNASPVYELFVLGELITGPHHGYRLYEIIQQHHKQINIVFANAGVGAVSSLTEATEAQLDRLFTINVKGTFFTIQQALPLLQDGSSIILNASITTSLAWPGLGILCAGKKAGGARSRAATERAALQVATARGQRGGSG